MERDQISLMDYFEGLYTDPKPKEQNVSVEETALPPYEVFRDEYCQHMGGYLRFGDEESPVVKACSYKNLHLAKGWDDWQPCTKENCPFYNGRWANKTSHESETRQL